jgi:tetratricopeptide (TPR) repeat protein
MRILLVLGLVALVVGRVTWLLMSKLNQLTGLAGVLAVSLAVVVCFLLWWKRKGATLTSAMGLRGEAEHAKGAGDFGAAERILKQGLDLGMPLEANAGRAVLHWDLGLLYAELERNEEAIAQVRAAITAATGSSAPYARQVLACAPRTLLALLERQEDWKEHEAVLRGLVEDSIGSDRIGAQMALAKNLIRQEQQEAAIELLQECVAALGNLEEDSGELLLDALHDLGDAARDAGRLDLALDAFVQLKRCAEELNPEEEFRPFWIHHANQGLGQVHQLRGEGEVALAFYEETLPYLAQRGDEGDEGACLFRMSEILLDLNRWEEAAARARQTIQLLEESNDNRLVSARTLLEQIEQVWAERRHSSAAAEVMAS